MPCMSYAPIIAPMVFVLGYLSAAGYLATGVIQAACYWVMGIVFLLNDYQIVPMYRTAARVSFVIASLYRKL